jgi:hypothetical protein
MIETIIVGILSFILGILLFPLMLFIRARRNSEWDDSNIFNMYRVVAYLAIHPDKFGRLQDEEGNYPFWYINKDEFSDIV